MSHTRSYTAGLLGVEGLAITIEATVDRGHPSLTITSTTGPQLDETRERVRAAMNGYGHKLPARRQVVTLTPDSIYKDSPGCDLAIACALLVAHGVIPQESLNGTLLWAELDFDGRLRAAAGTLIAAETARHSDMRMITAESCAREASAIPGLQVIPARNLAEVVALLRGDDEPRAITHTFSRTEMETAPDLIDIVGMELPKLALAVMIAGGHNLLLQGPPGVGKTMLARRVGGLLPDLPLEATIEVSKIHGIAHRKLEGLITRPPVRMPHHTVSVAGLLGGGNPSRPGEVSLAHRGVLFLDELPEFSRACIEGLREPVEDRQVTLVRARYALHYPARFQLLAAMNSCPCGYLGHPERVCTDSPAAVERYQNRVSGRVRSWFDLRVEVEHTRDGKRGESSSAVREQIIAARELMTQRLSSSEYGNNAEIPAAQAHLLRIGRAAKHLVDTQELDEAIKHRVLCVARTVQDLNDAEISASPFAPINQESVATSLALVGIGT